MLWGGIQENARDLGSYKDKGLICKILNSIENS